MGLRSTGLVGSSLSGADEFGGVMRRKRIRWVASVYGRALFFF